MTHLISSIDNFILDDFVVCNRISEILDFFIDLF